MALFWPPDFGNYCSSVSYVTLLAGSFLTTFVDGSEMLLYYLKYMLYMKIWGVAVFVSGGFINIFLKNRDGCEIIWCQRKYRRNDVLETVCLISLLRLKGHKLNPIRCCCCCEDAAFNSKTILFNSQNLLLETISLFLLAFVRNYNLVWFQCPNATFVFWIYSKALQNW